jgi:hypothetical protein
MTKKTTKESLKAYAATYRERNRELINKRRREIRAAKNAEAYVPSESDMRGRRCRECGDRCLGTSYYYCENHYRVIEDEGALFRVGSLDAARDE